MSSESKPKKDNRYASLNGGIDAIEEPKCGIGPFTPSWLQCFANPKIFVLILLPTLLLIISAVTYTGAILTTIEKEFQISSTESGLLTVINDITGVVVIVFVAFLGHNSHRPRWLGTGILIVGIGMFICAFPHFSKDVFDVTTISGEFVIPDYCFIRNFDPSKLPQGFDPSKIPGFDPSKIPGGFDPSKIPEGFDPSKIPEGFDPSKIPGGFDPSNIPEGFDPSKIPEGFDPSKIPAGFDPSKIPGFNSTSDVLNMTAKSFSRGSAYPGPGTGSRRNSSMPFFPGGFPFASNFSIPLIGEDCENKGVGSTMGLIIGQVLQGIGGSFVIPLSFTYLDDSLPIHQTVFYAALILLAIAFGPVVGYLCSALSLSKFVDFDRIAAEDIPDLSQYDPRWIGAWWLGYIFIGTATIIMSIPFFLFPKRMPSRFKISDDEKEADVDTTFIQAIRSNPRSDKGVINTIKLFLQAMKRLIMNPTLMSLCLAGSAELAILSIFIAFIIKYVITQFGVTPVTATIIVGSVIAPCSMLGNLFAGIFCRKFKLGPKKASLFVLCCVFITLCVLPVLMFAGCNNPEFAGLTTKYGEKEMSGNNSEVYKPSMKSASGPKLPNLNSECNTGCSCRDNMFLPVCGSDGITYASGCHAGCSQKSSSGEFNPFSSNTNYTGCTCISESDSDDGYGQAVSGVCSFECNTLIIYTVFTAILSILNAMKGSPLVSIILRIVADEDRSVAIGFQMLLSKVMGYFPAPLYFGAVINSACLLWQTTCGEEGACLMYDIEQYRYSYFGLLIGLKVISFIMFLIMYSTIKPENNDQYKTVEGKEQGCSLPMMKGDGTPKPKEGNEEEMSV
ncbi:solute carrier organic anion transporter family member 2A1-like isoform X2 [Antedon mediterranea]|uniref:solute carrier organic anion transporter family member 2A1-like isoform X2 n=1 Tax=Antedon mediterranea TaxID=105859 RepID=UPI003AF7EB64